MEHSLMMAMVNREQTLLRYSLNLISKSSAIEDFGLRDYSELLFALGDAGLKIPMADESQLKAQSEMLAAILQSPAP